MDENALEALGFTDFDAADFLETEEQVRLFLEESIDAANGDAMAIAQALGTVARSRVKMKDIAEKAGLSRESLYKALSGGRDPAFSTVLKVLGAMGLKIAFVPAPAPAPAVPASPIGVTTATSAAATLVAAALGVGREMGSKYSDYFPVVSMNRSENIRTSDEYRLLAALTGAESVFYEDIDAIHVSNLNRLSSASLIDSSSDVPTVNWTAINALSTFVVQ